ncbi:MAG: hypothetical protein Q8Q85_07300 [Gemmatimonadales bacterium]|nr:hypothetical protein [Gemmatimonadales bacterium]
MLAAVMFALTLAIFLLLAWHVRKSNRNIRSNYEVLAAKFGLQLDASRKVGVTLHPSVAGVYRGRETQVATLLRRRGRALTRVTVAKLKPAAPSFSVRWHGRVRPSPDQTPVETRDAEFDRELRVTSSDPERLRAALNADRRAGLRAFLRARRDGEFIGTDQALHYEEDLIVHTDAKRVRIESVVGFLHDLASALEGGSPGPGTSA